VSLSYTNCGLCPRNCGVDRNQNERGYCGAPAQAKVALANLHHWEEPCISGSRGSGTVFFSHCNLGCIFCQNAAVSQGEVGLPVTPTRLAQIFLELQEKGAHNINLVTPTHYLPDLLTALTQAKSAGLTLPIVYNCSGYERREVIAAVADYIDIFLPDLKYATAETAKACANLDDYFQVATAAIRQMAALIGECRFDENGLMTRGLIVRHLVLPGKTGESKTILRWIKDNLPDWVMVSLMGQYLPVGRAVVHPEYGRKLTKKEYQTVVDYLLESGLENGYCQEWGAADDRFIPNFDLRGV
jgi:putative pyruvate formate lyase activating enzyme